MTYDAEVAIYINPDVATNAWPDMPDSPARRLRDALEPIGTQGWWARGVYEHPALQKLQSFEKYVWGRAASLGEPSAPVVVAAFGVFEPTFLARAYDGARKLVPREEMLEARAAGATAALAEVLRDADIASLSEPLLAAVQDLDVLARPLFGGLRDLPLPQDPHGRLWRAAELVREHRGDGHLGACLAAGLDAIETNILTELWTGYAPGEYAATRGFSNERIAATLMRLEERGWVSGGRLTDEGLTARLGIEEATDRSQQELIERIGDQVEDLIKRADRFSAQIVAANGAPTDPRKRAAG